MDFSGRYVNREYIGVQRRSVFTVARRGNLPGKFKVIHFLGESFGHGYKRCEEPRIAWDAIRAAVT